MKRRELLGLFGTLPLLLAFNPIKVKKPTYPQEPLINLLKREIKYNERFSWMAENNPNPYIGSRSTRPTAIIVRNNIIVVRVVGTMFDQMEAALQRDELIEVISSILNDTVVLYTKDNSEIELVDLHYSQTKTIVRYGRYIHYQYILVNCRAL